MGNKAVFFHITDIHYNSVYGNDFIKKLINRMGTDFTRQLGAGLGHMAGLCARPDFILISGDLVQEGSAGEYRELRDIIAARFPGVPLLAVPGNHDGGAFSPGWLGRRDPPAYYEEALPGGLRLFALDSRGGAYGSGRLDARQLRWLTERLAENPGAPSIVMLHHTPHISGEEDFLVWQTENPGELASVLRGANVLGVFSGHTHMRYESDFAGIPCHTGPSIAYEIDSRPDRFILSTRTGYNLCEYDGALTVQPVEVAPGSVRTVEIPYSEFESASR